MLSATGTNIAAFAMVMKKDTKVLTVIDSGRCGSEDPSTLARKMIVLKRARTLTRRLRTESRQW